MTAPRMISRSLVAEKPYVIWNEFVDVLAMSDYGELSMKQRPAHLVFWYHSEVENGGHMQYFENRGTGRVEETIAALHRLGAPSHATVLARAATQFRSRQRSRIRSVDEYVDTALAG